MICQDTSDVCFSSYLRFLDDKKKKGGDPSAGSPTDTL